MDEIFCNYAAGMLADQPPDKNEHPFEALWAAKEETAYHEAGHAVAAFALSDGLDGIGLRARYVLDQFGNKGVTYSGICYQSKLWNERLNWAVNDGFYCWDILAFGIETAAGAAAERKYCLSANRPLKTRETAEGDRLRIDRAAWSLQKRGRNPHAYRRLIWRRAQVIMEDPLIWRAVDELASALGGCWSMEDELGDNEELLDGRDARAWIRETGVRAGMLRPKTAPELEGEMS